MHHDGARVELRTVIVAADSLVEGGKLLGRKMLLILVANLVNLASKSGLATCAPNRRSGAGQALGARARRRERRIYNVFGDGAQQRI